MCKNMVEKLLSVITEVVVSLYQFFINLFTLYVSYKNGRFIYNMCVYTDKLPQLYEGNNELLDSSVGKINTWLQLDYVLIGFC